MKVAKLVSGIVSIVLFALVIFQSCAAGLSNAMAENGEAGGSAGLILAVCLLIAGIVGLATRNADGKGGSITSAAFYILGAIVGFAGAGSYTDLIVWSVISVVFALIYLVSVFLPKKSDGEK